MCTPVMCRCLKLEIKLKKINLSSIYFDIGPSEMNTISYVFPLVLVATDIVYVILKDVKPRYYTQYIEF